MVITPERLLRKLPPFQGRENIIVPGVQSSGDIVREMLQAHSEFSSHYDRIANDFSGPYPEKLLFEFCQSHLPYNMEPGEDQTTCSPAAIILQANGRGVDCKHYALMIAGVLSALQRKGLITDRICYRFCNYSGDKRPNHVFVVIVNDGGKETWIDPTPIELKPGRFTSRGFNDRKIVPSFYYDKKVDMLTRMSGVNYKVNEEFETASHCGKCEGVGQTGISEFSVTGAVGTALSLASFLPDSGLKNFLVNFSSNPIGAIINLFSGKYKGEGYRLAEIYMRNVLGMREVTGKDKVPDNYLPQASQFFSLALGVPVISILQIQKGREAKYFGLENGVQYYDQWNNANGFVLAVPVTAEQKERARKVLMGLNFSDTYYFQTSFARVPLAAFASQPYIYPLVNSDGKTFFTGVHPVTNETFVNGYPAKDVPGTGIPGSSGTAGGKKSFIVPALLLGGGGLLAYKLLK